jgi:hypothetical protein
MRQLSTRAWTDEDIARLKRLSDEGATVNRAAAALNRKTEAVKKVCRIQGFTLIGTRQAKAAIRALDERSASVVP